MLNQSINQSTGRRMPLLPPADGGGNCAYQLAKRTKHTTRPRATLRSEAADSRYQDDRASRRLITLWLGAGLYKNHVFTDTVIFGVCYEFKNLLWFLWTAGFFSFCTFLSKSANFSGLKSHIGRKMVVVSSVSFHRETWQRLLCSLSARGRRGSARNH